MTDKELREIEEDLRTDRRIDDNLRMIRSLILDVKSLDERVRKLEEDMRNVIYNLGYMKNGK